MKKLSESRRIQTGTGIGEKKAGVVYDLDKLLWCIGEICLVDHNMSSQVKISKLCRQGHWEISASTCGTLFLGKTTVTPFTLLWSLEIGEIVTLTDFDIFPIHFI